MNNSVEKILNDFMKNEDLNFVSEKDFQVALAVYLKENLKDATITCEYPTKTAVEYEGKENDKESGKDKFKLITSKKGERVKAFIDIVINLGDKLIPIELKYRTKDKEFINDIELSNQLAYDAGSYGYLRDICRISEFVEDKKSCGEEFAIFLTNDKKYTEEYSGNKEKSYENFWFNKNDPKFGVGRVNGKYRKLDKPQTDLIIPGEWGCKEQDSNHVRYYKIAKLERNEI